MKKGLTWLTAILLLAAPFAVARGEAELSYEGIVVAGETVPVAAPYGGRIGGALPRAGAWVEAGETLAEIRTTLKYAPVEGRITGLYAEEGDGAESVTERYGAVLYIEPTHKYTLAATSEKAFNSS